MTKKYKISLILLGVIIVFSLVGAAVYTLQRVEQSSQTTTSQPNHCTTYNGTIEEQCTEDYVNLPIAEAVNKARESGLTPKTLKRDGKAQGFTDEGPAVIYFEVENDVVTKAYFEGNRPQS